MKQWYVLCVSLYSFEYILWNYSTHKPNDCHHIGTNICCNDHSMYSQISGSTFGTFSGFLGSPTMTTRPPLRNIENCELTMHSAPLISQIRPIPSPPVSSITIWGEHIRNQVSIVNKPYLQKRYSDGIQINGFLKYHGYHKICWYVSFIN